MKITMTAAFCAFCVGTLAIADTVVQLNSSSLGQSLVQQAVIAGPTRTAQQDLAPIAPMSDPMPAPAQTPRDDAKTVSVTPHNGDA